MGEYYDFGECLQCGKVRKVKHHEWARAANPKCYECGGTMTESKMSRDARTFSRDTRKGIASPRRGA